MKFLCEHLFSTGLFPSFKLFFFALISLVILSIIDDNQKCENTVFVLFVGRTVKRRHLASQHLLYCFLLFSYYFFPIGYHRYIISLRAGSSYRFIFSFSFLKFVSFVLFVLSYFVRSFVFLFNKSSIDKYRTNYMHEELAIVLELNKMKSTIELAIY